MNGSIYKQPESSKWWVSYYLPSGKRVRKSAKTSDKREAEKFLRECLSKVDKGTHIAPRDERLTVSDLLDRLEQDYRVNGKNATELAYQLKNARDTLGSIRARDLSESRVEAYKAHRIEDGRANATINRELAGLRRAFRLAHQQRAVERVPHFAMLREDNAREGFVSREDLDAVRAHLSPVLSDVALFAFLVGWRKASILSLSWSDVEVDDDGQPTGLWLRAKNSKTRKPQFLPLGGELQELLVRRLAERTVRRTDGTTALASHVFHREGKPVVEFKNAWDSAREKAGLPTLLFHDLRRSAVRELRRSGVQEKVCMAITGHRTRSTFDRYNIVDEDDLAEAMELRQAYKPKGSAKVRSIKDASV